ncbi:hypothetical protein AURDEDRAFT_126958 [Auricularia subglabra TFB-10046 SS5]|nr:hypothetical protein AURDEDRAFT_126958 [Auricularia subglabra TFB-10046 SS5]
MAVDHPASGNQPGTTASSVSPYYSAMATSFLEDVFQSLIQNPTPSQTGGLEFADTTSTSPLVEEASEIAQTPDPSPMHAPSLSYDVARSYAAEHARMPHASYYSPWRTGMDYSLVPVCNAGAARAASPPDHTTPAHYSGEHVPLTPMPYLPSVHAVRTAYAAGVPHESAAAHDPLNYSVPVDQDERMESVVYAGIAHPGGAYADDCLSGGARVTTTHVGKFSADALSADTFPVNASPVDAFLADADATAGSGPHTIRGISVNTASIYAYSVSDDAACAESPANAADPVHAESIHADAGSDNISHDETVHVDTLAIDADASARDHALPGHVVHTESIHAGPISDYALHAETTSVHAFHAAPASDSAMHFKTFFVDTDHADITHIPNAAAPRPTNDVQGLTEPIAEHDCGILTEQFEPSIAQDSSPSSTSTSTSTSISPSRPTRRDLHDENNLVLNVYGPWSRRAFGRRVVKMAASQGDAPAIRFVLENFPHLDLKDAWLWVEYIKTAYNRAGDFDSWIMDGFRFTAWWRALSKKQLSDFSQAHDQLIVGLD